MTTAHRPTSPPTIQEADAKIAELTNRLNDFQKVAEERIRWVNYRASLLSITGTENGSAPSVLSTPTTSYDRPKDLTMTGDMAIFVLRKFGPELTATQMAEKMHLEGWEGSGNAKMDKDRIYSAIHRRSGIVEKVGPERWKLREQKTG